MTLPPWIPGDCSFPSTDWSIVRAAASPNDATAKAALENLCLHYWHPIYAFIRREGIRLSGTPKAGAQDVTQEFFAHILTPPQPHQTPTFLTAVDPQKGSFKAYLRGACRNFLINKWKKDRRDVLNGPVICLESLEPPAPDEEFDLDWAFAVLTNALKAVRRLYVDRGKAAHFDCFRAYLPLHEGELPNTQAEAAKQLGITVENFKKKLHELRQEFARQVHYQVAQTLSNPEDVEQEIAELLASVRRLPRASAADSGQPTQEAF
jgi:RNA polymerase sigma-70 factor (ECF subfamily)